jgi:hypothetical protein
VDTGLSSDGGDVLVGGRAVVAEALPETDES